MNRKKVYQPGIFVTHRGRLFFLGIICLLFVMMIRAVHIHIFPPKADTLTNIATNQYQKKIKTGRYRGAIYDRNKEPLAISIRQTSFFINPKIFNPTKRQERKIRRLLQVSYKKYKKLKSKKGYFAWVKRKVSRNTARIIQDEKIRGLYTVMEPARFYPAGRSASNLIGAVGMDDTGLYGLEQQYNSTLQGAEVSLYQEKDAKGRLLYKEKDSARPEASGDSITLTIDKVIQEISENALKKGIIEAKAKSGFAIVMDPNNGAILAAANYPNFDPNTQRIKFKKNFAFVNAFEPGSVVKPFVLAAAIDNGVVKKDSKFFVDKGRVHIGRRVVSDSHKPEKKYYTAEEIIIHSSNVGVYKIAQKLGRNHLHSTFKRFGIGAAKINFPGESQGWISNPNNWSEVKFANIAFGQGLMMNGLEISSMYAAFANGGYLVTPTLIKDTAKINLNRVLKPRTAKVMRDILSKTVENGIHRALPDSFTAAGKTGTAQKVIDRKYSHTKHLSSFVGFSPVKDPYLVVYVQLDEPDQKYSYGSMWAAPIYKEIIDKALPYLNVKPERIATKKAEKSKTF